MNYKDLYIHLLQPESPLENEFFSDDSFIKGLSWGTPRKGHPEGEVYKHIIHVFKNIDRLDVTVEDRQILRVIALTHDSFKYKEVIKFPRDWSKHHALYATQFLAEYTTDETLLGITKWHDEAYYCWRAICQGKNKEICQSRLNTLFDNIKDYIQLYYLFFICDTMTGDKDISPIKWFEEVFKLYITPVSF